MGAMIRQQVVDDVRATLVALIASGLHPQPTELPFTVATLGGRTITIRGIVNNQYTVDVAPEMGDRISLTISEHLP